MTLHPIVAANDLGPLFIWIIIGIIWAASGIMEANKKRRKREEQAGHRAPKRSPQGDSRQASSTSGSRNSTSGSRTSTSGSLTSTSGSRTSTPAPNSMEAEVHDLFRRLTGEEPEPSQGPRERQITLKPRPQKSQKQTRQSSAQAEQKSNEGMVIHKRTEASKVIEPTSPIDTPRAELGDDSIGSGPDPFAMTHEEFGANPDEVAKVDMGNQHGTMNTQPIMVTLDRLNIPIMSMPIMSLNTSQSRSTPPNLRKKKSFQQAMMARIILEPPKALQQPE